MRSPKLLNVIAVRWEPGTKTDDPYMLAYPSAFDAAEDDEAVVGIYKLVGKKRVRKVIQSIDVK